MRSPEQIFIDALGKKHLKERTISVYGLAVPYNVYNTYNEIIRPATFADQASSWWPIPCLANHGGHHVGYWTQAKDTPEGLLVYGKLFVRDPMERGMKKDMEGAKLSIDYMSPDDTRRQRINLVETFHKRKEIFSPQTVTTGILVEISLVSDPAFPKTWLKVGEPDWLKQE